MTPSIARPWIFAARLFAPYAPQVQRELFALGERGLKSNRFAPAVLATVVVLHFGGQLPSRELALWVAALVGATLTTIGARACLQRAARGDASLAEKTLAGLALPFHAVVIGVAWSSMGLLFTPDWPLANAIVVVIQLGVMAAGTASLGVYSARSYALGVTVAVLIMLFLLPRGFGDQAGALQWGLAFYGVIAVNTARGAHATMVRSIQLQFANEELLAQKAAAAERAERANREKSLFLAAASHDLRQPVHALLLLIEALRQRTMDAAVRDLVEYMQQAGNTIGKLFSALMELSRLESGSEKAEPTDFELAPVLAAAIERHRPMAAQRDLGLSFRLERRAAGSWVHTDRVLLDRILDNLVSNALRYTHRGRVLVTARMRAGGTLWIEVRDTGIGIAEHEIERIFEPYYQVANPERDRRKGLGLGMAIVRRTAQLLGHPLTVRSRLGSGTCFRLELSVAPAPAVIAPAGTVQTDAAAQLAGRRVLVVDDDPMVLRAMEVLFATWGVEARCVTDGLAALNALDAQAWQPDAILCDFRLADGQSGIEVLESLSDLCPQAAAILQTGELAPEVRDAAEDAGYLVLTKPVAADTLARTLEALLPKD